MTREDGDETSEELVTTSDMRKGPEIALVSLIVRVLAFAESVGDALVMMLEAHFLTTERQRTAF